MTRTLFFSLCAIVFPDGAYYNTRWKNFGTEPILLSPSLSFRYVGIVEVVEIERCAFFHFI